MIRHVKKVANFHLRTTNANYTTYNKNYAFNRNFGENVDTDFGIWRAFDLWKFDF